MLFYFMFGCLFILILLPLIENLVSMISAWGEYIVYIFALKVYKIKQQLLSEQDQESKQPVGFYTQAIGRTTEFQYQDQEQE